MLLAILFSTVAATPPPLIVEHCIDLDGEGPHCLLEQVNGDRLTLLMTEHEQSVLADSPLAETIFAREKQVVSEAAYFETRALSLGAYLFERGESGKLKITAAGFPDGFEALAPPSQSPDALQGAFGPKQTEPGFLDPQLSESMAQCVAGVFGSTLTAAGAGILGGLEAASHFSASKEVLLGGAILGGITGAISGAGLGYAQFCSDEENKDAKECKPAPADADEDEPECDPATQSCPEPAPEPSTSTPSPDAAPNAGITAPGNRPKAEPVHPRVGLGIDRSVKVVRERIQQAPAKARIFARLGTRILKDSDPPAGPVPPSRDTKIGTLVNPGSLPPLRRLPPAPRGGR